MTIYPFKKKLSSIRYSYGDKAVEYFANNPRCEICLEPRICVLNIHHIDGKNIENFKTLCHNCHMIEHNPHLANETYESYIKQINIAFDTKTDKDAKILKLLNENVSIRKIISIEGTSIETIHKIMKTNGFVSEKRKGYKKI